MGATQSIKVGDLSPFHEKYSFNTLKLYIFKKQTVCNWITSDNAKISGQLWKVNFHQFLDMVTTQYSGIQKDKAELTQASFWELKVDNKKRQNIENSKPNIRNRKKSGKWTTLSGANIRTDNRENLFKNPDIEIFYTVCFVSFVVWGL